MKTFSELETYAKENYVPIARKPFVDYLVKLLKDNNYKKVLEIGCAIGYTAITLALNDIEVISIEYNQKMYEIASENIKDFNVNDKINLIYGDACEVEINDKVDLVFIDAAKGKNIRFFEKFKENLNDNGLIIIDNMELKELKEMANPKKVAKYEKMLVELKEYLNNLIDYEVTYNDIGDGIAILKKKIKKKEIRY